MNKELLQQALDEVECYLRYSTMEQPNALAAALRAALAQPVQPANLLVSEREVQLALGIYYATTGLDEFAEESIADMRKVLEAHETRKVTS